MKTRRSIQKWPRQVVALAKTPLDRLIPFAKISHFPRDSRICTGDQFGDCAYLVLKGKCEYRGDFDNAGTAILRTFVNGDTFGGLTGVFPERLAGEVVATEDSVVLAIRTEDLANLRQKPADRMAPATDEPPRNQTTFFFNVSPGRMISFVFLSDRLPAQYLSEIIARRLRVETGDSAVLVHFAMEQPANSADHNGVDFKLAGDVVLPGELHRDESGLHLLRVGLSAGLADAGAIRALFQKLRRRFRYVIVAVAADQIPAPHLIECIEQSHTAHFFLRPSPEDLYRLDLLLHEVRPRLSGHASAELKPVLCLADGELVAGFDARIVRIGLPCPIFIRGCPLLAGPSVSVLSGAPAGSFHADIRRMARGIGDCLVGLALSSGGAKGFAHIGVIQVLEENGLEADVVTGASMGAYIGSIWACGHNGTELERLAREMEAKWAMWSLLDPVILPWQGFLRGYAVKRRLQRSIGDAQFSDLVRPLHVVAANLDTMERIVFSTGDVASAVHASTAVPGIVIPVQIGEEIYIDGGIVDPLPTDVLREMGVQKIIAVNTIPTPDRIRFCQQAERELAQQTKLARKLIRKLLPANQYVNHYAHGNVLEILMHSTHGAQMRVAEAGARLADVVLHPDMCDDRWLDFRNPGQYIKAGREIALLHLDEIKALLKEKGVPHEHESPPPSLATAA